MKCRFFLILITAAILPFSGAKALNWNEGLDGDLSNDGDFPTFVTLTEGSNLIMGTMGRLSGGATPIDADVWTFTIAAGYYLTGIDLLGYSAQTFSPNTLPLNSFMALAEGSSINMSDPSLHLSNALWTEELDGFGNTYTDLLALLDAGPEYSGLGLDAPLGPGTYTFWIQEGEGQVSYNINMVVTAVPEPGSMVLLGVAGLSLLRRRRRR